MGRLEMKSLEPKKTNDKIRVKKEETRGDKKPNKKIENVIKR
jgi:hypothetical protein